MKHGWKQHFNEKHTHDQPQLQSPHHCGAMGPWMTFGALWWRFLAAWQLLVAPRGQALQNAQQRSQRIQYCSIVQQVRTLSDGRRHSHGFINGNLLKSFSLRQVNAALALEREAGLLDLVLARSWRVCDCNVAATKVNDSSFTSISHVPHDTHRESSTHAGITTNQPRQSGDSSQGSISRELPALLPM